MFVALVGDLFLDINRELYLVDCIIYSRGVWYSWPWGIYSTLLWPGEYVRGSSFLAAQSQRVVKSNWSLTPWDLDCDVLQSSILLPLLFNVYLWPLSEILMLTSISPLFVWTRPHSLSSSPCMGIVREWMWVNQLKLKLDKTELIVVDRPNDFGGV